MNSYLGYLTEKECRDCGAEMREVEVTRGGGGDAEHEAIVLRCPNGCA